MVVAECVEFDEREVVFLFDLRQELVPASDAQERCQSSVVDGSLSRGGCLWNGVHESRFASGTFVCWNGHADPSVLGAAKDALGWTPVVMFEGLGVGMPSLAMLLKGLPAVPSCAAPLKGAEEGVVNHWNGADRREDSSIRFEELLAVQEFVLAE